MKQTNILQNVIKAAQRDKEAAKTMYLSGHYTWSLFMWHLVIEKTLKAILMSQGKQVVYTHNLMVLYKNIEIDISSSTLDELAEINRFNIEARYDFEKEEFYRRATKEYADQWVKKCEHIITSLRAYVAIPN